MKNNTIFRYLTIGLAMLLLGVLAAPRLDGQTSPLNNNPRNPATRWLEITPADANLDPIPRALRVTVAGDLVIRGDDGHDETIPVDANETLPFSPTQVRAATTATVVGLY